MTDRRPCSVCRRWFLPKARARKHQKTCSSECSRELHRRACAEWRAKNPHYDLDRRLRDRVQPKEAPAGTPPTLRLPWPVVRDAVGQKTGVVIEEVLRVLESWTREEVRAVSVVKPGEPQKVLPRLPQEPVATSRPRLPP